MYTNSAKIYDISLTLHLSATCVHVALADKKSCTNYKIFSVSATCTLYSSSAKIYDICLLVYLNTTCAHVALTNEKIIANYKKYDIS